MTTGTPCYLCGRIIPDDDPLAIAVNGATEIGLLCFACQDDAEPLTAVIDWHGHSIEVEVA